jgi:ATP/maltotriose-dependent transcriptional regulator MalT
MTIDTGEAVIRTVIAAALAELGEANGRVSDALFAMRQAEAIAKALEHAGYEIRRRS